MSDEQNLYMKIITSSSEAIASKDTEKLIKTASENCPDELERIATRLNPEIPDSAYAFGSFFPPAAVTNIISEYNARAEQGQPACTPAAEEPQANLGELQPASAVNEQFAQNKQAFKSVV